MSPSARKLLFFGCAGAAAFASIACGHPSGTLQPTALKGYPSPASPATSATPPVARPPTAAATAEPTVHAPLSPPPQPLRAVPPVGERDRARSQVDPLMPPTQAAYMKREYEPPMPLASDGRRFSVRGVDRSDVLNIRAEPGAKSQVIGEIPPETTGIVATGARRQVGPGIWREVTYRGIKGWVNERFLVEERNANSGGDSNESTSRDSTESTSQ